MKRTFVIISVLAIVLASSVGKADNTVAVKSNLLYDALLTANAGVELSGVSTSRATTTAGGSRTGASGSIGSFNPRQGAGSRSR